MPAWELNPFANWGEPQTVERYREQLKQELVAIEERRAWVEECLAEGVKEVKTRFASLTIVAVVLAAFIADVGTAAWGQ